MTSVDTATHTLINNFGQMYFKHNPNHTKALWYNNVKGLWMQCTLLTNHDLETLSQRRGKLVALDNADA